MALPIITSAKPSYLDRSRGQRHRGLFGPAAVGVEMDRRHRSPMGTDQLDIDNIVAQTDTTRDQYATAPKALRIGHMHLRVGDVARGRNFYEGLIGMEPTRLGRPGVAFLSSGRHHHHIGINTGRAPAAVRAMRRRPGWPGFPLRIADDAVIADRKRRPCGSGPRQASRSQMALRSPIHGALR